MNPTVLSAALHNASKNSIARSGYGPIASADFSGVVTVSVSKAAIRPVFVSRVRPSVAPSTPIKAKQHKATPITVMYPPVPRGRSRRRIVSLSGYLQPLQDSKGAIVADVRISAADFLFLFPIVITSTNRIAARLRCPWLRFGYRRASWRSRESSTTPKRSRSCRNAGLAITLRAAASMVSITYRGCPSGR